MPDKKNKSKTSVAMRYVGIGTQWFVMIGLGVWGGIKLDERLHLKALFVIIFPVIALAYSLWTLIRSLKNSDK